MIKRSKLRFYSLILSVLLLFSGITGCTKQAAESKTKGNTELSSNDNALKAANSAVSNNLESLDTNKEAADAESNYEYAKEILFWQPEQKLEVTSKSKLDSLKVDDKIPAVQFFLDDKFTIEIETKYDYEALADNNQKYTIYPDVNGLDAVGNLYYYEDTETKDSKQNIKEAIRPETCVRNRNSLGGTSYDQVACQLGLAKKQIEAEHERISLALRKQAV